LDEIIKIFKLKIIIMKNRIINKCFLVLLLIAVITCQSNAQNYPVGHKQITYTDPSRSNRSIQTEIYYPATSAGDNTPIVSGQFPLIVFGHGFMMVWSAYQWMWDSIVPHGYIMAFPRTEGSISPSHSEFGLDLAFLNNYLKTENSNSSSYFYQHITIESAIMGHSMGGGASFLAAANNTNLTTLINFAAATTTPSSIDAALNVTVPTLVFIGENDGVAPPASNQIPMYDSCASQCKTRITILGGGHCYFANSNTYCSIGEGTTSPQPTITRDDQHIRTFYMLMPYLNYMLKNDAVSGATFLSRLTTNSDISYVRDCTTTEDKLNIIDEKDFLKCLPNPAKDNITIQTNEIRLPAVLKIYDITGREIFEKTIQQKVEDISIEYLETGTYYISLSNDLIMRSQKLIKE
jgi:pimeloyl-ACP methyl ester carboxylesterase